MFKFILFLLLHAFFTFIANYAYEEINLWYSKDDMDLFVIRKPSLYDLKDTKYVAFMQSYVEHVIAPAERYFAIREDIEKYQKENDHDIVYFIFFLFIGATTSLCSYSLYKSHIIHTLWVRGLISFAAALLITFIVYFSYSQYSKAHPKRFRHSIEELKKSFEYFEGTYESNISKDCALNNYVLEKHNEYLQSIKSNIIFRNNIREVIWLVAVISIVIAIAFSKF